MLNRSSATGYALALYTAAVLGSTETHAATVSATAAFLDRNERSGLLTFSNDTFVSDASTPAHSGFNGGSALQPYLFSDSGAGGSSSFASVDASFAPMPQTSAGSSLQGQGSATSIWTFDWSASGSGQVSLVFNYLTSTAVLDYRAGETAAASSLLSVSLDGTSNKQEVFNFFQNQNGELSNIADLALS